MKKILLSLLVCSAVSLVASDNLQVDPSAQAKADKQMKIQNRSVVKHVIEEYSSKLPQKVDKYTTFTNIAADDLTLIYTFEINTGAKSDESVIKEDGPRMEKNVVNGICQSARRFLQSDIALKYVYKSAASKKELFAYKVEAKDCVTIWK